MAKPQDDNARLMAGTLAADPAADTEVMRAPGLPEPIGALVPAAFARMRARHRHEEKPIPLPWPTLNAPLSGGLWPGLHVLVGNTAAGKTQWCLQVAIEAAQAGTPVLYIALEAGDVEFVARCLGLLAGMPWSPLYHGRTDGLETLIATHGEALAALPLHVQLAPPHGWDYNDLPEAVAALRATYPETTPGARPVLVVLDFLQIVGGPAHEDLRERIGRAAYTGRGVARTHNAAVLVASSTARTSYSTLTGKSETGKPEKAERLGEGNPARFVGLGKESGEVEYSADTVLVLTQEPWTDNTPPAGGTVCHLALAKVRAGHPDWVELRFDGRRFTEPASARGGTLRV